MMPDLDAFLEITEFFPDAENAVLVCLGKETSGQFVIWSELKSTYTNVTSPRRIAFEPEARCAYQELIEQLTKATIP